jgi:hypothetical protein
MNNREAKKLMQHGTLFTVEGTSVVGMSLGYKGKGEIDSFNLIDVVEGIAVKRCDGKCRLATKRERMMYWAALTHIAQKGEKV